MAQGSQRQEGPMQRVRLGVPIFVILSSAYIDVPFLFSHPACYFYSCGLRYARSRAKKEGGGAAARRRKDRTVGMVAKGSPSGSPVGMSFNNGLRGVRGYDEQFSTGSASGSDMYPPAPGHAYHEHTSPSPSPPSNSMNYVPYAHHSSHPHPQNNSPIDNRSGHFPGPPPPQGTTRAPLPSQAACPPLSGRGKTPNG